jgi:hypothetical protein
MIEKSCACGKSKKNFKMDIGPFYVADCCKDAGYDDLGRLTADSVEGQTPEASDPSLLDRLFNRTEKAPVDPVALDAALEAGSTPDAPADLVEKANEPNALQKFFGANKPSRKKLKNMRVEELVALASAKGIEFKEGTTKPTMIDAILAG